MATGKADVVVGIVLLLDIPNPIRTGCHHQMQVRNTLSPETMGDDQPRPGISASHSTLSVFDHLSGSIPLDATGWMAPRTTSHIRALERSRHPRFCFRPGSLTLYEKAQRVGPDPMQIHKGRASC